MKCEDYKKAIAADPSGTFEGAGHTSDCVACARFRAEIQNLDALIGRALAIEVPELRMPDLPSPDEIADDNVVNLPFRRLPKLTTPAWIGVAASFALAAIVGLQLVDYYSSDDLSNLELASEVLAHLDHEPQALRVTNAAVSEDRLASVVHPGIGTMSRDIGLVTYARTCVINGRKIPHLVIQGRNGPVTLLLMPDEMVASPVPVEGQGVNGLIVPVGDGSVAIIGEREEPIGEIRKRVLDSVEWTI